MEFTPNPQSEYLDKVFDNAGLNASDITYFDKYEKYQKNDVFIEDGIVKPVKERSSLKVVSAADLSKMDIQPPHMVVDNLIPVGLTVLAAPSKFGKSWMAMQLCFAVSKGKDFLKHKTNNCGVLYFALEDSEARLKDRMMKQQLEVKPENILFVTGSTTMEHNQLLHEIDEICSEVDFQIGLIIIDTLQKIRGKPTNKDQYQMDYEMLGKIQAYSLEKNLAILIIHHTRKSSNNTTSESPYEKILGSSGIPGAADTMIVLSKGEEYSSLNATGRDVIEQELSIEWFKEGYQWTCLGDKTEVERAKQYQTFLRSPLKVAIEETLDELEEDEEVKNKVLVKTASELRQLVYDKTGEEIGETERLFASKLKNNIEQFKTIGIEIDVPYKNETVKGKTGRYYRISRA